LAKSGSGNAGAGALVLAHIWSRPGGPGDRGSHGGVVSAPRDGCGGSNTPLQSDVQLNARNVFNNVNLAIPIGNLSSPLFGQPRACGGPYSSSRRPMAHRFAVSSFLDPLKSRRNRVMKTEEDFGQGMRRGARRGSLELRRRPRAIPDNEKGRRAQETVARSRTRLNLIRVFAAKPSFQDGSWLPHSKILKPTGPIFELHPVCCGNHSSDEKRRQRYFFASARCAQFF